MAGMADEYTTPDRLRACVDALDTAIGHMQIERDAFAARVAAIEAEAVERRRRARMPRSHMAGYIECREAEPRSQAVAGDVT